MAKTEREKMITGEEYFPFGEELVNSRKRAQDLFLKFNITGEQSILPDLFQQKLNGVRVNPPFHCDYGENIKLGENVFINFNCTFLSCAEIFIGDNTWVGPCVQIYTAIHPLEPEKRNTAIGSAKSVIIGKDCWIGGGVIILPGIEIGEGTTIGAGSVVTKNIPAGVVAAGNPCKVIRKI